MTDEIQESNSPSGSAGSPNQTTSQGQGVQPTSAFDADQLLKQLEPLIEKKVQSVKDRRLGEFDKRLGDAETVLGRVKELIPADKFRELEKDLEFEELKRRVYGEQPQTGASVTGTQQTSAAVDTAKVFSLLNLPENAETTALKARTYGSEAEAAVAALHYFEVQKSKPVPTDADRATPQASPPPTAPDAKAIEAKMGQLNKMYKNPSKYKNELPALEKELEAYLPK